MEVSARLTSKGQVTIPSAVRKALSLRDGDRVSFRVDGERAILARTPGLLELAGSIAVPAEVRGAPWASILAEAHREQAEKGR